MASGLPPDRREKRGHAIDFASYQSGEIMLDNSAIENFFSQPILKDRPIAIVSIFDEHLLGEKIVSNFFLHYLQNKGVHDMHHKFEAKSLQWYGDYGHSSGPSIKVWSEVFPIPMLDGTEVAVLVMKIGRLMHSQEDHNLLTFGATVSSVLIYNIEPYMEEFSIQALEMQDLWLLLRARSYGGKFPFGTEGKDYWEKLCGKERAKGLKENFSQLHCYRMPDIEQQEQECQEHLKQFAGRIFDPKNIVIKLSDGRPMTATEVVTLMKQCTKAINEINELQSPSGHASPRTAKLYFDASSMNYVTPIDYRSRRPELSSQRSSKTKKSLETSLERELSTPTASTEEKMKFLQIKDSDLIRKPSKPVESVSTGRGFSSSTEKDIPRATGGEIELYGCKIVIPAESREKDASVKMSIESGNTEDKPEDSIPISPSIDCDLKLKEGYEMEVEVPVFCFANEPVTVHLLTKTIGAKNWITEKVMTLGTQRKLVFKTSHFSRKLFVILRQIGLGSLGRLLQFPLTPHLYYNGRGVFGACFGLDDQLTDAKLRQEFIQSGFQNVLTVPQRHIVQIGNIFEARLSCSHPNLREIVLDGEKSFEITEELICAAFAREDFQLREVRTRARQQYIKMNYDVGKKGSKLKRNIFDIDWPPHTAASSSQTATAMTSQSIESRTDVSASNRSFAAARDIFNTTCDLL